jgi:hypothetical protein
LGVVLAVTKKRNWQVVGTKVPAQNPHPRLRRRVLIRAGAELPPIGQVAGPSPAITFWGGSMPPFLVKGSRGISRIFVRGKSWLPLATPPLACFPIFPIDCWPAFWRTPNR